MKTIQYPQNKPMTAAGVGCTRLELWLVDLPKPDNETHVQYGTRPAIVISNDAANENSPARTAASSQMIWSPPCRSLQPLPPPSAKPSHRSV